MTIENRRRRRVVASHEIAFTAFRLAGVFAAVAGGWAIWVLVAGGSWWGPMHALLLGTVTLAIGGATQLFTITWAAAPAPPASVATAQRWSVAAGAATVLVGMTLRNEGAIIVGGIAAGAGLLILAFSLVSAVRHSLLRRFDLSARFYLLGIGCVVVGVTLGVLMGIGLAGDLYSRFRVVHGHLNLVGFVGFTIIGTIPTILPTFAHHRSVSGREAIVGWWMAVAAALAMLAGLVWGERPVGMGTLLAGAALVIVVSGVVGRLGRTAGRGGLPLFQVIIGCGWLAVWAIVDGARLLSGATTPAFDVWMTVAVVAGVGQVLLGSLAYLLPVLFGPGPVLGRNFERFDRHRWLPLASANGAAFGLLLGANLVAVGGFTIWVVDFARRLISLERGSRRVNRV